MGDERPEPQSQAPNLAQAYREQARQLARRFAVLEGVVGVALVGGLTIGKADRYSDIDLAVYLRHRTLRTWLLGAAPLPEGPSLYHQTRLDLSYRDFAEEQARDWTPTERWQALTAELLYDPEGLIADLFAAKATIPSTDTTQQLAAEFAALDGLLENAVPAWLYRGDPLAAHEALNRAVTQLIRLLYLVNQRPVPSESWRIHLADELPWRPADWSTRLAEALTVAEPSNAEARRRRQLLANLARECWTHAAPPGSADLAPPMASQYLMLREMADVREMPLAEFRQRFGPRALLRSPAFDLLTITHEETGAVVRFQHDRLEQILESELGRFLDEQQRLLRQLESRG